MRKGKDKKTPEIVMRIRKEEGIAKLTIRNAGIAGNILQFKIVKDKTEFIRVVPPNHFVGVYNDPAIAKGEKSAIKKGKHAFISNNILTTPDDAEAISQEVQKVFPAIWKLVKAGIEIHRPRTEKASIVNVVVKLR
jgi:hypothetical protein